MTSANPDKRAEARKPVFTPGPKNREIVKGFLREKKPDGRDMAVFLSANRPSNPLYAKHAREIGMLIGSRGHNLIWGGTQSGTMYTLSQAARQGGAMLVGVGFESEGEVSSNAHIVLGARSLDERKKTMIELSDVAIALAGGLGTLGEIGTVLEEQKTNPNRPPLVVLSSDGFYDHLAGLVDDMHEANMLNSIPPDMVIRLAKTPEEAIDLAETVQPPPLPLEDDYMYWANYGYLVDWRAL